MEKVIFIFLTIKVTDYMPCKTYRRLESFILDSLI